LIAFVNDSINKKAFARKPNKSMKEIRVELRKNGGDTVKKTWKLEHGKTYTIGRVKEMADIVIEEVSISRSHAQIKVGKTGSTTIQDMNSGNSNPLARLTTSLVP
jgi:pSer/pThr/pTyr-binding forkhead associated (FHA) protein